jgi:predicted ATPase/transcriptional regulator with XRE-family HTH domain
MEHWMTVDMTFGEWLKRRRRQLDLTQSELAEQAGCSVGTIQKIEQDLRRPSKQLAELLATQLHISAEQQPAFITFARTEAYMAEMTEALAAMGEIPLELETIPLKEENAAPGAVPQTAPAQTANNLPLPATPFIGRETELAELDKLIADPAVRLVTIVGTGGMGKTRLALATADRQLNHSFASTRALVHGVFFIDLARLDVGEQIIPALADALNFPLSSGEQEKRTPKQQILDYLRQKQMLLIMDNFEHLLEEANLVADILRSAPAVKILVTSRERLQLQEEHLFIIHRLEFPDWETGADLAALEDAAEYTAVKLFLQSARRLRRNFQLQADDLTYLSRICRLVEGMPLAVELAAGWVDLLSLREIADELARSLDMLETNMRNVPQRQRSLRAVFDTSWERLSQAEQSALMGFSLFRGGCTREAAQAVTGTSLRTLANLSNKSLIQYRQRNGRYQIHALLRQYAAEKLALNITAETAARGAHCTYYCTALAQWERVLKDRDRPTAVAAIRADYDDIRTAWEWAVANSKIGDLTKATNGWGEYFIASGYLDAGERIFQEAVATIAATHPVIDSIDLVRLCVRLQTWQIKLSLDQHLTRLRYHEEQEHLLRQNLSLLSDWATAEERFQAEEALIRLQLARIQKYGGEHQTVAALTELETSLYLYRQLEDKAGIADVLSEIAWLHFHQRSLEQARELLSQSLAIWQETGNVWRLARGLSALQAIAQDMGDFEAGFEVIEQMADVVANLQTSRNSLGLAALLMLFASKLTHVGRFAAARRWPDIVWPSMMIWEQESSNWRMPMP